MQGPLRLYLSTYRHSFTFHIKNPISYKMRCQLEHHSFVQISRYVFISFLSQNNTHPSSSISSQISHHNSSDRHITKRLKVLRDVMVAYTHTHTSIFQRLVHTVYLRIPSKSELGCLWPCLWRSRFLYSFFFRDSSTLSVYAFLRNRNLDVCGTVVKVEISISIISRDLSTLSTHFKTGIGGCPWTWLWRSRFLYPFFSGSRPHCLSTHSFNVCGMIVKVEICYISFWKRGSWNYILRNGVVVDIPNSRIGIWWWYVFVNVYGWWPAHTDIFALWLSTMWEYLRVLSRDPEKDNKKHSKTKA